MFHSKANSYALLSLIEIARSEGGQGVQAHQIASQYNLPTAYAAKVMSQLAKAGVLRSDRGPRGGFMLGRPAKDISLLNILEALNGPMVNEEILPYNAPKTLRKNVDAVFAKVVTETRKQLEKTTLDDLAGSKGRRR